MNETSRDLTDVARDQRERGIVVSLDVGSILYGFYIIR